MMQRVLWAAILGLTLTSTGCASRQSTWEAKPEDAATAPAGESKDALIAQGDESWKKRDERASLETAIGAWENAVKLQPNDAATLTKLSHAYYFLADAHLRKGGAKSEEYLSTFEKGVAIGERALAAANPKFKELMVAGGKVEDGIKEVGQEGVEPMYWYAASLGKWARAKGFATTLGNKERIKSVMGRVLELDPNFFHGAADRYFGAFYAVAPGFAGGSMEKSKEHFEKSLALAPNYAGTKVLMADVYAVKKQDRALFDKLLDEVLSMPADALPGLEPETKIEKEKAAELKTEAADKF